MSSKSQIINKIYEKYYLCEKEHSLKWTGQKYVFDSINCNKCDLNQTKGNVIRWKCDKCETYYCCKCLPIIVNHKCPNHHQLKCINKNSTEIFFNSYTCDRCYISFSVKDGLYLDKDCNYTICKKCYEESLIIPDNIED